MNLDDLPQITSSAYSSTVTDWCAALEPQFINLLQESPANQLREFQDRRHQIDPRLVAAKNQLIENQNTMSQRRIVQIFIADPDINVPLEQALLHKSEPKFTDATDQELYFETPVAEILKAHNEKRVKWLDKDATKKSGREVLLEPAKIRELKMVVVNIAVF